jgi:hypothetical protein
MKRTLTTLAALTTIALASGCAMGPAWIAAGGATILAKNQAEKYALSLPQPLEDEMHPVNPILQPDGSASAPERKVPKIIGMPNHVERRAQTVDAAQRALEVVTAGKSNTMTEVAAQRLAGNKDYQPASTCKIVPVSETVFDIVC